MIYPDNQTRENIIRSEFTKEETIRQIQEVYHARYDPINVVLDAWDQLLSCEAVAEATSINEKTNESKSLVFRGSESVSGACYSEVNSELILSYSEAIQELKLCKSDETPPIKVAAIIEKALGLSRKEGHWLHLSQRWNPRQIVWVLTEIYKEIQTGRMSPEKAPDCFTFRLKKRARRKI